MHDQTTDVLLSLEHIGKRYGSLIALHDVHFDLRRGEVHAVAGEHGAGKSTLARIIGGIITRDSGKVYCRDREVNFTSPNDALRAGIALMHRESSLLPRLSVMENVFLGRMNARLGLVLWKTMSEKALKVLDRAGLGKDPHRLVRDLHPAECRVVEIARALSRNAELIVMDEPASSLSRAESRRLFRLIGEIKMDGISVVYASRNGDQALEIADRITVLRDGRTIGTMTKKEAPARRITALMGGREPVRIAFSRQRRTGEAVLRVNGISGEHFTNVSFDVRRGEIVSLSGLGEAGRSEMTQALAGAARVAAGRISCDGEESGAHPPAGATTHDQTVTPEPGDAPPLIRELPMGLTMAPARPSKKSIKGLITDARIGGTIRKLTSLLDAPTAASAHPSSHLTGGRRQRAVAAGRPADGPRILILNEPTHNMDSGAKGEIYNLMRDLTALGLSIILISSQPAEIMRLSDRVVVLHRGEVTGILDRGELTADYITTHAAQAVNERVEAN